MNKMKFLAIGYYISIPHISCSMTIEQKDKDLCQKYVLLYDFMN